VRPFHFIAFYCILLHFIAFYCMWFHVISCDFMWFHSILFDFRVFSHNINRIWFRRNESDFLVSRFSFLISFLFSRSIYIILVKFIRFNLYFHSIYTFHEILSDIHESDTFLIHLQFLEIYSMSYWNQYMANHRHRNIGWK
jgi:hypothetical protein